LNNLHTRISSATRTFPDGARDALEGNSDLISRTSAIAFRGATSSVDAGRSKAESEMIVALPIRDA